MKLEVTPKRVKWYTNERCAINAVSKSRECITRVNVCETLGVQIVYEVVAVTFVFFINKAVVVVLHRWP